MISGELVPIIEIIDYSSKAELISKLRLMRSEAAKLPEDERQVVREMLSAAIDETYCSSAKEIMHFKHFLEFKKLRKKQGGKV